MWSTRLFYGQFDFLCGQLYTFYVVNSTFYMVNYTFFIWSTRLFMWSTIHLLYGQRDLFTAKYKLFIRPGNALRDQTQTKLRKLSSPRMLFEAFELLKKHESKARERNEHGLFLFFDGLKFLLLTITSFEEAERSQSLS